MSQIEKMTTNEWWKNPLIAILRGIQTDEVTSITEQLISNDIRLIEVPLNSPDAINSIQVMTENFNERAIFGGGTVLTIEQVEQVNAAGGCFIVSPNCNPQVIKRTVELGMISIPGVATPSEAFAAIEAGARILKLFPATGIGTSTLKSMMDVLPDDVLVLAVGGIEPGNMDEYWTAGATGFGLGGCLYRPGDSPADVKNKATSIREKYTSLIDNNN